MQLPLRTMCSDGMGMAWIRGVMTGVLASLVAFARKSSAQPFVAIEDFWGGAIIGFSVGYFGFQNFADMLKLAK
ncbi:hypothetical protein [Streptomyces sp. Ac-502]|uniref:hypothetical protein n=1 Tax=Streptomyces sp. Ac-502 TaxID=3342801 RepID=UPI0038625DAA